jgi:hypothetical protein
MKITLETNFVPLIHGYADYPEGINKRIVSSTSVERRDFFTDPTAAAVFTFASGVAASVFANWLYNKIKSGPPHTKIKINHREVTIDKNEIMKIITEEIEIEQQQVTKSYNE